MLSRVVPSPLTSPLSSLGYSPSIIVPTFCNHPPTGGGDVVDGAVVDTVLAGEAAGVAVKSSVTVFSGYHC